MILFQKIKKFSLRKKKDIKFKKEIAPIDPDELMSAVEEMIHDIKSFEFICKFLLKKYQYDLICSFITNSKDDIHDIRKNKFFSLIASDLSKKGLEEMFPELNTKSIQLIKKIEPYDVDLKTAVIYPHIWEKSRFSGAMKNINSFEYHPNNHLVIYLKGTNCYLVTGGNHSIATGIIKGIGSIKCKFEIDVFELLDLKDFNINNDFLKTLKIMKKNSIRF